MLWLLMVVGMLAALIAIVVIIGLMLPKRHVASVAKQFNHSPEALWAIITDYASFPLWRSDVARVEQLPDQHGHSVWREIDGRGEGIAYETLEFEPPRRLVRRIAEPKLPFGGTWTMEIVPSGNGCQLTITENGEVYNPIFRFVSRFIIGYTATMERYLQALDKR